MPLLGSSTKQPSEIENYAISYAEDLEATDTFTIDFIGISVLSGDEAGIALIDSYLVDEANQRVKMFISGGVAGSIYKVTVRIMTDSGRRLEDEFKLKIKEY